MKSQLLKTKNKTVESKQYERIIGSIEGAVDGPTVIILAGIHGNEPSGVNALRNVFDILHAADNVCRGKVMGIRANLQALDHQVRYIDEDMNRIWFPSIIEKIRSTPADQLESAERVEIKNLLPILDRSIPEDSDYPTIVADLHSFSAEGNMFAITAPKKSHTDLLTSMHVPMVFGIENTLRGTALRYYQDRGHVTFALEGGQHQNKLTAYNQTAALILLLKKMGCLGKEDFEKVDEFSEHLHEQSKHLPERVELIYQHIIEEGDQFAMRPGFRNFQYIKKGEWLANDREGEIRAECDGYLIMPLYQDQGNDGFFVVRKQG